MNYVIGEFPTKNCHRLGRALLVGIAVIGWLIVIAMLVGWLDLSFIVLGK